MKKHFYNVILNSLKKNKDTLYFLSFKYHQKHLNYIIDSSGKNHILSTKCIIHVVAQKYRTCLQYSTFRHWLKYKEQSVPISQEQSEKNASSANLSVCKITLMHLYCAKATWSCIISVEALILKASSLKDFSLCWLSLMTAEVTILLTERKLWTLTRPEYKNSLKIMYRTLWVNPWHLCIHITMAQYGFHFSTGIFGDRRYIHTESNDISQVQYHITDNAQ